MRGHGKEHGCCNNSLSQCQPGYAPKSIAPASPPKNLTCLRLQLRELARCPDLVLTMRARGSRNSNFGEADQMEVEGYKYKPNTSVRVLPTACGSSSAQSLAVDYILCVRASRCMACSSMEFRIASSSSLNWRLLGSKLPGSVSCLALMQWLALWMSFLQRSMAQEWPCTRDSMFQAAIFLISEEGLNRDRHFYFPFLGSLPKHVSSANRPDAHVQFDLQQVQASLDPSRQSIHLSIPFNVSAEDTSYTTTVEDWCPSFVEFDAVLQLKAGGGDYSPPPPRRCPVTSGCSGRASVWRELILSAHLSLQTQTLEWQSAERWPRRFEGSCLNFLPQVRHFDDGPVIEFVRQKLEQQWMKTRWGRDKLMQKLDLGPAAHVFVQVRMAQAQVMYADQHMVLAGFLDACIKGKSDALFAPRHHGLQKKCYKHLKYQRFYSAPDATASLVTSQGSSLASLAFSCSGSSEIEVAVNTSVGKISLQLSEQRGNNRQYTITVTLNVVKHARAVAAGHALVFWGEPAGGSRIGR